MSRMGKMMGTAMYLTIMEEGVQIDRFDNTDNGIVFLFTVPKSSYQHDAHGKEMSGKHLASRVKHMYEDMGVKFADIRYGIRDEHWNELKAAAAKQAAYSHLGYKRWEYER